MAYENYTFAKEEFINETSMFLRFRLQVTSEKINTGMKSPLRGKAKELALESWNVIFGVR
jgi:hypothetical protein